MNSHIDTCVYFRYFYTSCACARVCARVNARGLVVFYAHVQGKPHTNTGERSCAQTGAQRDKRRIGHHLVLVLVLLLSGRRQLLSKGRAGMRTKNKRSAPVPSRGFNRMSVRVRGSAGPETKSVCAPRRHEPRDYSREDCYFTHCACVRPLSASLGPLPVSLCAPRTCAFQRPACSVLWLDSLAVTYRNLPQPTPEPK
jgi:hypothetical protein